MLKILFVFLLIVVSLSDMSILIGLLFATDKKVATVVKSLPSLVDNNFKPRLYIVISLFNESKTIEETIYYFLQFLSEDIRLILVTTEKETELFGSNKTFEKIQEILYKLNNSYVSVVNYPGTVGNKGAQLNFLLQEKRALLDDEKNYFVVYDCDSRPDKFSIQELYEVARKGEKVIQQSTLYTRNFEMVSTYMQVEGIFETIRAIGIERYSYVLTCLKYFDYIMPYAYCVGHGMCFNCKFLYEIGGFPEPNEDVPQGMKLMLLKQRIVPLVCKDHAAVVRNIRMLFYQSGNWVKAPLQSFKIVSEINQIKHVSICRKLVFMFNVFGDMFSWFQYALLLMTSVVLIYNQQYIGLWGMFVIILCPIIQAIICCKMYKIKMSIKMFAYIPLRNIFRAIAIFSALFQKYYKSYNEIER